MRHPNLKEHSVMVLLVVVVFVSAPAAQALGSSSQPSRQFQAGAATSNITPWLGISLAGSLYDRRAEHIHDELHARCLVLDDGQMRVDIVVVDSTIISQQLWLEIKQLTQQRTGIPVEHMLMSATHTHSAPADGQSQPDGA